jgi:hypothetical protein
MDRLEKNRKRLKLTFGQTITHYMIIFFMLFISGLLAKELFEIYITKNYSGVSTTSELVTMLLPILFLATVFAYIQYRRLDLKEIQLNYTDEQFQEAIRRTVDDLEWRIEKNQKNYFRAYRPWNWTGSWGEMITIMKYKDRLLINSICDPNNMPSVISYGWNKKNLRTFLTNLSETIQDIPKEPKKEEVTIKNEWSLKMILIRLFAYPFCLILIGLGIYMILNPLTIRTFISGIGAIIIATIYLYLDLKILARKRKQQKP